MQFGKSRCVLVIIKIDISEFLNFLSSESFFVKCFYIVLHFVLQEPKRFTANQSKIWKQFIFYCEQSNFVGETKQALLQGKNYSLFDKS